MRDEFPDDADGGVLRRLRDHGFDFTRPHTLDFNVEFGAWPPQPPALAWLKAKYGTVSVYEPEDGSPGEVVVHITGSVSYDFVVGTQAGISGAMNEFGGRCETWGVSDDGLRAE